MLQLKDYNITLGGKKDFLNFNNKDFAVVHATHSSYPSKDASLSSFIQKDNELYINWQDVPETTAFTLESMQAALDFIGEKTKDKHVFIYCDYAQSRSPTLLMTYLAKHTNLLSNDFYSALEKFKELYPEYHTPSGISRFVKENWNNLR